MPMSIDPVPGENEIECARCGAIFSIEFSRCPKCGVNLYEPGDESEYRTFKPHSTGLSQKIGNLFRRLTGKPDPAEELFNQSLLQAQLYNDLLHKVGGDRATVDRLIEFEHQRLPNSTRLKWLQNAVQRWEKDNQ